jgi:hypothetical protein
MPTYDIGAYIPSLKEPQHKTYLGNASLFTGYVDAATMIGAATGTTADTVVIPIITLPHGALIDKWEIKASAMNTAANLSIGFRYVNPAAAIANPRYGSAAKGMPTPSATYFATDLDSASLVNTSDILYDPFICQADVQIILTIDDATGDMLPANAKIALIMTGRYKGAL